MKERIVLVFAVIIVLLSIVSAKADEKLSVEEIIAKHLDSIASKEKRDSIKNQIAIGVSEFLVVRGSSSKTVGNAVIISEAGKVMLGTKFNSLDYPFEKVGFDGSKVDVAFVSPGLRSPFGNFIFSNKNIFSEGLFGGSLSSSWALLDAQSRKAKITSSGKKKIDGREVYILEYSPKRGSDITTKLFFDAQTFQHIRTEYRQIFSAAQGVQSTSSQGRAVDNSAQQQESRHTLTEEFSDFSAENGLTVPHKYRIHLLLNGRSTSEFEWKFEFSKFLFNQNLEANSFDVSNQ